MEAIAFSLGDDVRPPCLVMERMELSLFDYLDPPLIIDFTAELGIVLDVCKASRSEVVNTGFEGTVDLFRGTTNRLDDRASDATFRWRSAICARKHDGNRCSWFYFGR